MTVEAGSIASILMYNLYTLEVLGIIYLLIISICIPHYAW